MPARSPGIDAQAAAAAAEVAVVAAAPGKPKESLLNAAARARRTQVEETEHEKIIREEEEILRHITAKTALQAVGERARVGSRLTHSGPSWWRPHFLLYQLLLLDQGLSG